MYRGSQHSSTMEDKVQVCIFDMSRGQVEGQELDKILLFYPTSCSIPAQLSVVGLSEGLITFTRIFSPLSPCELMEAEKHTHIFYQCEPDVFIVMVLEKSKESEEIIREKGLRDVLTDGYNLFTMFYGPIRALLRSHPQGDIARSCLHAFFLDYLSDSLSGKKIRVPTVSESLTNRGTVPLFSPQRETLLEAQCLQEHLKSCLGGGTVQHVLVMFHHMLLSTTLPPEDTSVLFLYAVMRMIPLALSQTPRNSRISLRRESSFAGGASSLLANHINNSLGASRLRSLFTNVGATQVAHQGPEAGDSTPEDQGSRYFVPHPLVQEAWWKSDDGFLRTEAWGSETERIKAVPNVKLQVGEEGFNLCVYQHSSITVIMLVSKSGGSERIIDLQRVVLEKAAHKVRKLDEKLVKEWLGRNAWHVPGCRYLYTDSLNKVSRFSPPNKVATLSMESLFVLNRMRAELDIELGRSIQASAMDKELELCVRTKQNVWVIVRAYRGHDLYVVLEKASNTLLLACDAVEKLSRRYFTGIFSSD